MDDHDQMPKGVSWCARSKCLDCGRDVDHKPYGGPHKFHWCRLRFLSRARWAGHRDGWESGYRFGIENWHDDLVQADVRDFGSGWSTHMRRGAIEIRGGFDG